MKINWGTGIVIGMITFIAFIVTLGTKMMGSKVDLVASDYYEQGIEFEEHMQQVEAANALNQPVAIEVNYSTSQIEVKMPQEFAQQSIEGNIIFFRPSDKTKDFSVALKPNDQLQQNVPLEKLAKGNWKVQMQWKANGKAYYCEKDVVI